MPWRIAARGGQLDNSSISPVGRNLKPISTGRLACCHTFLIETLCFLLLQDSYYSGTWRTRIEIFCTKSKLRECRKKQKVSLHEILRGFVIKVQNETAK